MYGKKLRMQLDGAPTHYSVDVRNYLNGKFSNKWEKSGGTDEFSPQTAREV